jgi:iron complex transport system substrate-binding protein
MKKIMSMFFTIIIVMVFLLAGCGSINETESNTERKVVDMAGREVVIPKKINKLYSTGPIGTITIYTLAPDKLAGWNYDLRPLEKKYILSKYHDLPVLGKFRVKGGSGNIEEILKVNPDIVISMGDISERYISDAEKIQEQLNIPVLMVDGSLENQDEAYKFLGKIINEEEKAEELAAYCEKTIFQVKELSSKIEEEDKVRLYYAEGIKGLETEPKGTIHSEVIDMVGSENVVSGSIDAGVRRVQVSKEQILKWNPDVIIVSSDSDMTHRAYNTILNSESWEKIKAVKNNEVYEVPYMPYDWINRPPSVTRMIGIKWLGNILYPEIYDYNINTEIKEFFNKFYHLELEDNQIHDILSRAQKKE